jgi:hypothetical protein
MNNPTRGRPVTVNHRNLSHRTIGMTPERTREVKRVSGLLGISGEILISRLIDLGLAVFAEAD